MARPKPEGHALPSEAWKKQREEQKEIEEQGESSSDDDFSNDENTWYETAPGGHLVKYTMVKSEENSLPGLPGRKIQEEDEEEEEEEPRGYGLTSHDLVSRLILQSMLLPQRR
jgi:hypothetical protein